MAYEKKVYSFEDFEKCDLEMIPSLDLPSLIIDELYMPKDGGKLMLFLTTTRPKKDIVIKCPNCQSTNTIRSGKGKKRMAHDVIRNNYRVDIAILPQLYRCKDCDLKFTPQIDGIVEGRQMTTRLYEYLKKECFLQSHTDLAHYSGFSIETIQAIMDEQIEIYEEQRKANPPKAPHVLGIDEKHINYIMRGTLVDVENGELLDMLENNKASTMQDAIKRLKDWDTNIKVVTTDMNNSYLKWLPTLLPKATIVIDKFHVIQDIQEKLSVTQSNLYAYRKELIEQIEDPEERQRQKAILNLVKDNKYLFKYSMDTIVRSEKKLAEKLATVMNEFDEFKYLRNLYHKIESMYKMTKREDAEKAWEAWVNYLPPVNKDEYQDWCDAYCFEPELFKPFKTFSHTTFQFFRPFILNYFNEGCRFTNATTEGLNNKIGNINSAGNGYKFKHLRAKALFAPLVADRISYTVDLKSIKKWVSSSGYIVSGISSPGRYVTIQKYVFGAVTEPVSLTPINIYQTDDFIDSVFSLKDSIDLPETDADSVINATWDDEDYMCE